MTRDTGHLIPKVPPHGSNARNIVFYLTDIKNPFHAHNMEQETQQQKPYEPTLFFLIEDEGRGGRKTASRSTLIRSFFQLVTYRGKGIWVNIKPPINIIYKIVFYVFSCFGGGNTKIYYSRFQSMNYFKSLLTPLFELFFSNKRSEFIFPIRILSKNFSINRDVDYFCYKIFIFLFVISFLLALFLTLSSVFNFNVANKFSSENHYIISYFSKIMGPISFILAIFLYVKKRLVIDLKNTEIPYIGNPQIIEGRDKSSWVKWGISLLIISLILMLGAHFLPIFLVFHYDWNDNLTMVLISLLIPIFVVPYGAAIFIYAALITEKIIRYFSQIENDFIKNNVRS